MVELHTTRSVEAVAGSSAVPKLAVAYVTVCPVAINVSRPLQRQFCPRNAHEVDPHCPLASQHSPNVDPTQVVAVPSTIPHLPSAEMARWEAFGSQSLGLGGLAECIGLTGSNTILVSGQEIVTVWLNFGVHVIECWKCQLVAIEKFLAEIPSVGPQPLSTIVGIKIPRPEHRRSDVAVQGRPMRVEGMVWRGIGRPDEEESPDSRCCYDCKAVLQSHVGQLEP